LEPKHKGVGVFPVVKGIQANPRAEAAVPDAQRSYLAEKIMPSGWYPERDYNVLITLLAGTVDRSNVPDVWGFFGRAAARRDVAGDQEAIPVRSRTENVGIYRNFRGGQPNDIAGLCLRMAKVWGLYHDTGRLTFSRHARKPALLVARLEDFHFPVRGLAELQTAYITEFARLSGVELKGTLERFAEGQPGRSEWSYQLPATPENLAAMTTLSAEV
jgi:hypothetical protein